MEAEGETSLCCPGNLKQITTRKEMFSRKFRRGRNSGLHHKEVYEKKLELFKNKAKKEYLWENFANRCKLSVQVCKSPKVHKD